MLSRQLQSARELRLTRLFTLFNLLMALCLNPVQRHYSSAIVSQSRTLELTSRFLNRPLFGVQFCLF